ncbi:MAG: D-alanyl-D-alanine carboxypeptidase [Eubacterium sp.]|nr:D-alanyl-D-alanine carboxypeptidase [Eubacterium sp.]
MKRHRKICLLAVLSSVLLCSFSEPAWAKKKKNNQYWPQGPEIVSASGIVIEVDTGTVLYEKNVHDRHYPASITKIMTTLLAIENSKMDEVVTFSHDSVYNTEGSGIARDVDEQMTMEQCLYAVMLASANECAYAVAEHTAGDIGTFIQMMNDRAAKLGCKDTNFTNCNGLPDEQHYTSAYDMALIAKEAYQNETFRIMSGTKTYTIPFTNKHTDEETYLQNHHQMLYPLKTRKYLYEYCLGGKTGYTTVANSTLVTYAEKDGMTLICVVLNAEGSGHYEDTRALFDFCFDNFKKMNVHENEASYSEKKEERDGVLGDYEPFVALDASSSIILPITAEFTDAKSKVVYDNKDKDILGSINYTYAGRTVGTANLTATNAQVDSFQFIEQKEQTKMEGQETAADAEETEKQTVVIPITIGSVSILLLVILAVGALLFLLWKMTDNIYSIKRKLHINKRDKSPYKTIKPSKFYRRRGRKRF